MAVKSFVPVTPSLRFKTKIQRFELYKGGPEDSLTEALKKTGGRNNQGNITSRRRGGGHKRSYRIIDFKRNKHNIPGRVGRIEYDPNRSAHIALIIYKDGERRYILAPQSLKDNDFVMSGENVEIKIGNALPLRDIPLGTVIHNIELLPGKGGQIVRSAGSSATLMAKEGEHAHIQLPSTEVRMVRLNCYATIGQLSNADHENVVYGKAGKSRWLGRRPKVRGVAMNPVDHPMGGGEGKSSGGRHPCSPWGQGSKGLKTRKASTSSKLIIKRRTKKRKGK